MGLLTRDAILEAQDLQHEEVYIPEWGGSVRVRTLTGAERDAFEQSIVDQRGKDTRMNLRNIRAKLVALTVVDGDGKRLFSDADAKLLGQKSASALDKIFDVAQRLSGLRDEDVEELAKNSEDGLNAGSTFD
jgi:hypothetical protein